MKIKCGLIILLMGICSLVFSSCMTIEPEYLIKTGSDNGFVEASRGYYAIEDETFYIISNWKFDNLTLGSGSEYEFAGYSTYVFEVDAGNSGDVSKWLYKESEYDKQTYDVDVLITDLQEMGVSYSGVVYITITEFDEYRIVEAANIDASNTVLDCMYAVFKNDVRLDIPENVDMNDVINVYVHE